MGYAGATRMLKREGSTGGADTTAPITPADPRDDSFEWEAPRSDASTASDELTDRQRAQIQRDNEEAQRRRSEAYAAMAPATGEY